MVDILRMFSDLRIFGSKNKINFSAICCFTSSSFLWPGNYMMKLVLVRRSDMYKGLCLSCYADLVSEVTVREPSASSVT